MSVSQNLPNLAIGYSRARLLMFFGGGLLLTLSAPRSHSAGRTARTSPHSRSPSAMSARCFSARHLQDALAAGHRQAAAGLHQPCRIRDIRLADETIAWSAVRKILIWEQRGQKFVVLKVDPLIAQRFSGGFATQALALLNKALGADSVIVNAGGLTMNTETLLETCKQYWGAGRPAHADHPAGARTRAGACQLKTKPDAASGRCAPAPASGRLSASAAWR